MKIALISTEKLPVPAIRGGAIQIYLNSVASIIAKKHDVTVISIQDPELQEEELRNDVKYVRFPEIHYVEMIKTYIGEQKFDVIHLCNRPNWIQPFSEAVPQTKFVLSVHNEMFSYEKMTDAEGQQCVQKVSKIVTVSDFIGSTITNRFPEAKNITRTVYSGVDLHQFQPSWSVVGKKTRSMVRNELDLNGKKVVLFVGRLSKVKGPHLLLQAIPKIIEKHPDLMMVFIGSKWFGDDNLNNYVRHLYTLGAIFEKHVTFIKFVKPQNIPQLFTMSDLFVCSSQWQEPLARVHYEAMAAGLPLITSNRGGNPEVIEEGKNGYVIHDFENPEAYAKTINLLLDDSGKRTSLGKYGRKKVENDFSWNRVAENLLSVYEEVNTQ
ncbi:glycosyltransferase family 4 protein [Chengkuizengella axinellae]|uniref:Glycosyltransferase family 4 protein n=1 Tax=Chengkuizengella axinellae TaxID=3064388 RepID=A0ABT9J459_9BACL|nr:glycosyltransferase family 4 protein [Chengkuizengella sp. 2205SS18-9]MDP5276416.1 glycosyltransferase family 4 protein [Chengkuizengella sp. 2205SS18-9]